MALRVRRSRRALIALAGLAALARLAVADERRVALPDAGACGARAAPIHAVQGARSSSPLTGQVTIEGIVVGSVRGARDNSLQGFFLQEEDADADSDPLTS